MPWFKVTVQQWVHETGAVIVEAEDEDEAKTKADDLGDWNWEDGIDSRDFGITGIEPVDDPDNELGGDEDDYQELVEEPEEDPDA